MNKLDELLSIVDRHQRQVALIKYAESLGVDYAQAKDSSGEYNEEKLAILVFDATRRTQRARRVNLRFYTVNVLAGIVVLAAIFLMPAVFRQVYRGEEGAGNPSDEVTQGFNKDGTPLMENGQPVLFKRMNGEYQEFDQGRLKYEYLYDNGRLVRKKEFDTTGKVISIKEYPAPKR